MKIFRWSVSRWIFAALFLPAPLNAGDAAKQLSTTIDAFVPVINGTPRDQLLASGLPERARKLILARFDFTEMAKRALDRHWNSLTHPQRTQFVDAMTQWQLLSFGKIVAFSHGDEVQFIREVQDGKEASVETKVVRRYSDDLPIDYWLHNVNGQWKVYNIVIDRVDNVKNIRAQFDRVLAKSSLDDLLQRVKNQHPRS